MSVLPASTIANSAQFGSKRSRQSSHWREPKGDYGQRMSRDDDDEEKMKMSSADDMHLYDSTNTNQTRNNSHHSFVVSAQRFRDGSMDGLHSEVNKDPLSPVPPQKKQLQSTPSRELASDTITLDETLEGGTDGVSSSRISLGISGVVEYWRLNEQP